MGRAMARRRKARHSTAKPSNGDAWQRKAEAGQGLASQSTAAEVEHEEYYAIPESIFEHHELTDEEKKQYEDYFNKILKKDRE